jgi:ABC-type Zn uptake system ZnuABC Zn-binding protein ZnuA
MSKGEAQFLDSLKPLDAKIADMRKTLRRTPVIASEPVFGYHGRADRQEPSTTRNSRSR